MGRRALDGPGWRRVIERSALPPRRSAEGGIASRRRGRDMRRLLVLLPLLFFGALAAVFALGLSRNPSLIPSVLINKPLPSFDLPAARAGDSGLASGDLRGEPMLINMFASWCVSCRVEHPLLLDLHSRGVSIAGIDWEDTAAD